MKPRVLTSVLALLLSCSAAFAQKVVGDVDFQYLFDNREFDRGGNTYTKSMTINSAALTPWVGLDLQRDSADHRLMLGVDISKDFGDESAIKDCFKELLMYWRSDVSLGHDRHFSGMAGIYPRLSLEGEYGEAFISDSLRYYDRNMEGMLLKYSHGSFYNEIALDWMGQFGVQRRERFQVLYYGRYSFGKVMSAGITASMYHLASSEMCHGVVDNFLFEPYVKADLTSLTHMDDLSLRLGMLASAQRDRRIDEDFRIPYGAEFIINASKFGFGVKNTLYVGTDQMPYYSSYSTLLYRGDPFYRVNGTELPLFDRLDLYWQHGFKSWLDVRVAASLWATNEGYQGCKQTASLLFNLDKLLRLK